MHLIVEAQQRVGQISMFGVPGGTAEEALFSEFRTLITRLPEHPLGDLVLEARLLWPEPMRLFGEIHHHGTGFEDREWRAAAERFVVDYRGHAPIGRMLQKTRR